MSHIKKISIFYFSGTGNTEIVTAVLSGIFQENKITTQLIKAEDLVKKHLKPDLSDTDAIGIAFPVHAGLAPRIMSACIKRLPSLIHPVFIIATASSPSSINHTAFPGIKRLIKALKGRVYYESLYVMPPNAFGKYSPELSKRLYAAAIKKASVEVPEIINEKKHIRRRPLLLILYQFMGIISSLCTGFFGKDLTVSDACTHCQVCVKQCPVNNITLINKQIHFEWRCMMCMRCIYVCPVKAIQPHRLKFIPHREGYYLKKIIEDSTIGTTSPVKGLLFKPKLRHYLRRFG